MSKTKTYIKIALDKSAPIISCIELMESIKKNNIVEKVQIFSETKKDRSLTYLPFRLDIDAIYGNKEFPM
jgi:hypothetical protein